MPSSESTRSRPSIAAVLDEMRSGKLSSAELVDRCLKQIRDLDGSIHAWIQVDERGACASAEQCDRLSRNGEALGPMHGIPVGIKDIVDVAGYPTIAGAAWRKEHIAVHDAPVVARLRAAGAIILGKTATTQFAYIDSAGTRNPWNYEHTPGGSSSGSAAGVAAEMCWGAVATQTGGSTIRPAAFCGIVGCKPTFGSIDTTGVIPLCRELDTIGLMTACVDDARVMLGVMQSQSIPAVPANSAAPRLALVDEFFMAWAEEPVQSAVEEALDKFRSAGADVHPVSLPASFTQAQAMQFRVMAYGAAESHQQDFAVRSSDYGPQITDLIQTGRALSADDVKEAFAHKQRFTADMGTLFAGEAAGQILVMPATVTPAPANWKNMGDPRFNSSWTYAGVPVVTIPCGLSDDGLPIGLQFVGPNYSEHQLLAAAAWCESVLTPIGHPSFAART